MPTISTPAQALQAQVDDQPEQQEPEPPSMQLPAVQTDVQRPERDEDLRNLQLLTAAAGAFSSTIGAATDSPMATSIGRGLTQGSRQARQQADEQFSQRMSAYEEFLRDARQEQRRRQRLEAESDYEAALADYRLDRQQMQQRRDNQAEMNLLEREAELDEPSETEKAVNRAQEDYYQAGAEKRRAAAESERAQGRYYDRRPTTDGPESDLPSDPQDLQRELRTTRRQITELQERYNDVPTNIYGEPDEVRRRQIGQQIDTLIKRRVALEQRMEDLQRSNGQPGAEGRGGQPGQGGQGGGQGGNARQSDNGRVENPNNPPPNMRTESRETFMNQPAPTQGATPPGAEGRGGQPGASQDVPASGQDARQRPTDISDRISPQLRRRVRQMAPDTTDLSAALNAAALVQSDTSRATPARFERAFGFNPFQ